VTSADAALAELATLRHEHWSGLTRLDASLVVVCRALEVPMAKILRLSGSHEFFHIAAGIGWRDGVVGRIQVPATNNSVAGYALRDRRAILVEDIQRTERFSDAGLLLSHGIRSTMAVRIGSDERVLGVLSVHALECRRFSSKDAAFIEAAARIISEMID